MIAAASPSSVPEPTAATVALQATMSPDRWAAVTARAHERVRILAAVAVAHAGGLSHRQALAAVAPGLHWSTYLNWWRHSASRAGEPWERQLDGRVPPTPDQIPDDVRAAACMLRRTLSSILCDAARTLLVAQFGSEKGTVSDASLKRIWKDAGLAQSRGPQPGRREEVVRLSGGAGLALLAAAAAETGVVRELGSVLLEEATDVVAQAVAAKEDAPAAEASADGRDERGQFTAAYNRVVRGAAPRDPRRDPDAVKRGRRDLATLSMPTSTPDLLGLKFLSMGIAPLVTERRGFDGLEGPNGAWLAALGGTAYQAATLDKFLAEVALVDAGGALWASHGEQWARVTASWRTAPDAAAWLRFVAYVDATQDPYWTHAYSASGKVSRLNKVMPCLTRVAMMGGPGVPLAVETHAGSVSLKKELVPFLDRMEKVLGAGELGRLTVVDAEMATQSLMAELAGRKGRWFISVLKGGTAKAADLDAFGEWRRFRNDDMLRELRVTFSGPNAPEGGLQLRGVEMTRDGSRNPTSTIYVTNATTTDLATEEVATAYLSRWPHQERRFRDGRNGLGLNRSHGYGGQDVVHVALATDQEKAAKAVARANTRVAATGAATQQARRMHETVGKEHRAAAKAAVVRAERDERAAARALEDANVEQQRLATTPREIYVRDTNRDGIVTCAKLTVFMLIEFVLKEYFGDLKMEARTFIENFLNLPVTLRRSKTEVVYQIEDNPRSPANMARLRAACAEVSRRRVRVGGRRLRFEVVAGNLGLTG
jgi:hypothetical protein